MVVVVATSLGIGKPRVAFVNNQNVDLQKIVPFICVHGDVNRAGANLGDFVAVGYIVFAKVDTT